MTNEEICTNIVNSVRTINPDSSLKTVYIDGGVYIFRFGDEEEATSALTVHKKLNETSKQYDWFDSWMRDGDYYIALCKD